MWKLSFNKKSIMKKAYLNLGEDKTIKIPELNFYFHISRKLATVQKQLNA